MGTLKWTWGRNNRPQLLTGGNRLWLVALVALSFYWALAMDDFFEALRRRK